MTTARQKLYEYIRVADDKKVNAILTMVQDDLQIFHWANDTEFLAELDERTADYKSGKIKGIAWEQVKKNITDSLGKKA